MKKYNLVLTAATFLILDSSEDSMEVSQYLKCTYRDGILGHKFKKDSSEDSMEVSQHHKCT
jgi:hypothetical protein